MNNWQQIWEARKPTDGDGSLLLALLKENGYDTLGALTEDSWRAFIKKIAARLRIQPGDSIFDVGCGAGAVLWSFREQDHPVGGIDYSSAQITRARQVMPEVTDLHVAEAAALEPKPYNAVLACGTFLYFRDLAYASQVIGKMAAKAARCLALLDLPDLARKDEIVRERKKALGEEVYNQRYAGLDHQYYSRDWIRQQLESRGFTCEVEDQSLTGYFNSAHRFNAFAWK